MTSQQTRRPGVLRRAQLLAAGTFLSAAVATGAVTVYLATGAEASQESTTDSGTTTTTSTTTSTTTADWGSSGQVQAPTSSGSTSSHSSTSAS